MLEEPGSLIEPEKIQRFELPRKLAHDLRSPLNLIIGYSDLLMDQAGEQGHQEYVRDLDQIRLAGRNMLKMLEDNFASSTVTPPSTEQPQETASEQDLSKLASGSEKGLVLVVDDVEANRDVLLKRLQREGYSAASSENGVQALAALRRQTFDLVLLDIMMPEMDGFEVLRQIKADEALRHIPVIMISALDEMDSVARCIEMGAVDFLNKPFEPILLKARIGASLERKRGRDREMRLFQQLQDQYERLKELDRLREELTNMIVHDLRTPLTSVIAGMQSLEGMGDLSPLQLEMVEISVSGGETLLSMISDLLDIEKLESGTMKPNYRAINASEIVDAALAQVASLSQSRELSVIRQVSPDLPAFQGDADTLLRTMVNLLGNSIKFTPIGGTVTVSVGVEEDGQALLFSVRDTGEGIPAEAFGRIFEKFGQVESRKNGRKMSTGLGLTFCKLVVGAHGGQIRVESVPGQGSNFSFTIPIVAKG